MKTVGLIINPIAGLGGSVGLKGTDHVAQEALRRGAVPHAGERTCQALQALAQTAVPFQVVTWPGAMGGDAAQSLGLPCRLLSGAPQGESTRGEDTQTLAKALAAEGVELILFAGGDGTARDVYNALGLGTPVLGIPAGVKIHSPVFGRSPRDAGRLAALWLEQETGRTREEEVLDIDEELYRQGRINTRLYGYLTIPAQPGLTQNRKAPTPLSDAQAIRAIAFQVTDYMEPGVNYLIGAGTTTRGVMEVLGLPNTLIGVDLVRDGKLIASDLSGLDIPALLEGRPTKLVVTVTGGQGCLFGRGNQQLTPQVLRQVGKENIILLATPAKLAQLRGQPLWVDTIDPELNESLCGYYRVISGYGEFTLCRVVC